MCYCLQERAEQYERDFGQERRLLHWLNPYTCQADDINDLLESEVEDAPQRLLGALVLRQYGPDVRRPPGAEHNPEREIREFLTNMAAEDQYFHDLSNSQRFEYIPVDLWNAVKLARKRNAAVSTSYRVHHEQLAAAFEIR